MFVGYNNVHKGYKCLHIPTGRGYIPCDVVSDEHVLPLSNNNSRSPPNTSMTLASVLFPLISEPIQSQPTHVVLAKLVYGNGQLENNSIPTLHMDSTFVDISQHGNQDYDSVDVDTATASHEQAPPQHHMRTRLKDNTRTPK